MLSRTRANRGFSRFFAFRRPRRVKAFDWIWFSLAGKLLGAAGARVDCSARRLKSRGAWVVSNGQGGTRATLEAHEWLLEPPGADNLDLGPSFDISLGIGLFKKNKTI